MKTYAHRFYGKIFEAIHIKSNEVLLANRASICLIQDGCRRVNNNQNNIIMSNERTGVDIVLDWIVPIRLSGKWMSVEVERGVKIMLSLILLVTIPTHAISKTLEVVPRDQDQCCESVGLIK